MEKTNSGGGPIPFSDATLKIEISYDKNDFDNPIKKGDKLQINLVPEDPYKDFIRMDYKTSILNELMDNHKNPPVKVADIDMTDRTGVKFTFTGEAEQFKANLNLPFSIAGQKVTKYFKEHKDATEVTFRYKLQINGKDVDGKVLEYKLENTKPGLATQQFEKTNGTYNQKGKLGEGFFHYNIRFDTELRSPNEYVIYDLPDVNMGFDGDISIWDGKNIGQFDDVLLWNTNTDPNREYIWKTDHPNGTKVRVYDVYYISKESDTENQIRVPDWEEKKLHFDRDGGILDSEETATVPKDILFEKPLGSKLSAEEAQRIKDNGGLYTKVGKGFKVTLSDYKSNYLQKGGHITLSYKMQIKNSSPELDHDGHPIYKNVATYYAQEIPNCKPEDEHCTPIKSEKTKKFDDGSPDKPVIAVVKPGSIGADVTVPETEFTKVEADENGNSLINNPVKGAKFTIYKSDKDKQKIEIAKNGDNTELQELITNEDGKLTKDGKIIPLTLDNGYYIFSEISAPENYEIIKNDTHVTVGYKATSVVVVNKKKDIPLEKMYKAEYFFKAENESETLPESVMNLLPVDTTKYKDAETVNATQPKQKEVKVANGKWIFKGYKKDKETVNKADVKFIGIWKLEKGNEPSNPHNPSEPSNPSNPIEPGKPEPNNPKDPSIPSEPLNPNESLKPSTPNNGSSTTTTEKIGTSSKTDVQNKVAPQTIDNSNILTYFALAGLAGTLLITFNYRRKSN